MDIELDHLIVPARDRRAAAALLGELLGVPFAESGAAGPFSPVHVSDRLTLDFDQIDAGTACPVLHYAFRVDDAGFDAIVSRLQRRGIALRSTPHGPVDRQVNTLHGGRIVYWDQPDGHVWEALTSSYARAPRAGAG
jgi:catechol 2,3-dioxygenase-like lactoylglutathione lyase family enzyme